MSCKCSEIVNYMEQFAPNRLAQSWDNTGLLLGDPGREIKRILVALDATPEVVDEAIEIGAELIITHHPLIFKQVNRITRDTPLGDCIFRLIQNNISLYSAHTNLDVAKGGVNDVLASILGLEDIKVLQPISFEPLKKIAVFVPIDHVDTVREAMSRVGAGFIGNYSDCSFITKGIGMFKPLEGANPFIGQKSVLEKVKECKIETVVQESSLKKVIEAMLNAHPYEEVAYDVYNIENSKQEYGFARIGIIKEIVDFKTFAAAVKKLLKADSVKLVGNKNGKIKTVVVSSGSYSNIAQAAKAKGADVIVTGDLKYHDAREIADLGLCAIDAGHFATENVIVPIIAEYILGLNLGLEVIQSQKSEDIFKGL